MLAESTTFLATFIIIRIRIYVLKQVCLVINSFKWKMSHGLIVTNAHQKSGMGNLSYFVHSVGFRGFVFRGFGFVTSKRFSFSKNEP